MSKPSHRARILTTDGQWITSTPDSGDGSQEAEFFRYVLTGKGDEDTALKVPTAVGTVVIRIRNIERVHIEEHEPGLGGD